MRSLPHSLEAEQSVLGAMFLSRNALNEAFSMLEPSDFYELNHQIIYETMQFLSDQKSAIDMTTMTSRLEATSNLDKIGGIEYLLLLSESVPTASNIKYYIEIVQEKALARRIIETSEGIASIGYDQSIDTNDYAEEAEKKILGVTRNRKAGEFLSSKVILEDIYENLKMLASNKEGLTGIPTGFRDLDKITHGFQSGDLIIVAARPSVGKTAFALNVAQKAAQLSKKSVAIFSLEMGADQLLKRMISAVGSIEGDKLRSGRLSETDWIKYSKAANILSANKIYIDDTPGIKMSEIASKCRKLEREQGLGMIMIDYLQLIVGSEKNRENRQQEVSEISRQLKGLARELKVPVIALSQLSRAVEQRQDKRPMMSDLRESGAIEQDADIVAFLYRDDYYNRDEATQNGIIEIIIGKNRNGATGTIKLAFEKHFNAFLDLDEDDFIDLE